MKKKLIFCLAAIVFLTSAALADVTITPRKQIYRRPKPMMDGKRTFSITWPTVRASSSALSRKIEGALSYEKAFSFTVKEEIREIQWLESATYEVIYNKGNVLCVSLNIEGSGAYPDGSTKYIVVDTSTGAKQTPAMVFADLKGLASLVAKDQKKEIALAIKEIKKDPEFQDPDPSTLFADSKFTSADLKNFSVTRSGVTFHYDYGFPHVIQALQPSGEFKYSWAQIRPFLKPGGLLAQSTR
jgi:hypothetical protein